MLCLAGACALLATGCASRPRVEIAWKDGPFFTPTNFVGSAEMPADVRRVAVLPAAGLDGYTVESTVGLVDAMRAALGRSARFEAVTIPAERWATISGGRPAGPGEAFSPEWFDTLAREFGVDAVLLTEVTEFRAYAPLALGVRCKLARLGGDHGVVWSFDTVFDARNPAVANSVRQHAARTGLGAPTDSGPLGLQSPRRFAAYVFEAVFATLPGRKTALKHA